nr:GNAT family N-acetyltransferase [uncultured Desulfobulbus sp.]
MTMQPVKNELMHRFELADGGKVALLEYREQGDNVLVFTHTFVPPELRGKDLAALLTRFALEDAKRQGKKVIPQCSYTAMFMKRNKEFGELKAPEIGF